MRKAYRLGKIQLCNEIIGEHRPIARKTVTLIDSWYTGNEVISNCKALLYRKFRNEY
jgi:hypothetical protein